MPEQSGVFIGLGDDDDGQEVSRPQDDDAMPVGRNVIMEPVATVRHEPSPDSVLSTALLRTPGAFKLDGGKAPIYQGVVQYFSRAWIALAWVSEYGFRKYGEWGGWRKIPDALPRYSDAKARHLLLQEIEGAYDITDSGLPHAVQELWNAAARVELLIEAGEIQIMRGNDIVDGKPVLGTARAV